MIINKSRKSAQKGILVANLGNIQGGIKLVPKTKANNGVLQIGIIKAKNWYFWINLLYHALRGQIHNSENYTLKKGTHIEIKIKSKSKIFECDGNIFPPTNKLTIDILPQALNILLPNS